MKFIENSECIKEFWLEEFQLFFSLLFLHQILILTEDLHLLKDDPLSILDIFNIFCLILCMVGNT